MPKPDEVQRPLRASPVPPTVAGSGKLAGLHRIWRALFHSLDGIAAALRHEAAFREEAALKLRMPPPTGVVNGPLIAIRNSLIAASVSSGSQLLNF